MDKQARVGIITRTKDRDLFLKRAIESVLGQTFQDWIMVIVNDGGSNSSKVDQLVQEYESQFKGRCKVVHNKESLGMEAASNKGIANCSSDYLIIHDDDDSWDATFLEVCLAFFDDNSYPGVRGVVTHSTKVMERVENERIIIEDKTPWNGWLQSIQISRMILENTFPPISFLYERSVLDEIGGYNEKLPVLGDWDFNLRFLEKYDIFVIPKELANYHHRVSLKEVKYGNSVIRDVNSHMVYDTLFRNQLLRKDMDEGRVGMGHLVNFGRNILELRGQIAYLHNKGDQPMQQKARSFYKRIVCKMKSLL